MPASEIRATALASLLHFVVSMASCSCLSGSTDRTSPGDCFRRPCVKGNPATLDQTMECRIELSLFHLQNGVRSPGDGFDNVVAMKGAEQQCPQDEEVENP